MTTIPIRLGSKRPLVRWGSYQHLPPTRRACSRWFQRDDIGGLAAIHGATSAGLACRDYDELDAYDRWAAAHPRLAAVLPTSVSRRGPKVYFRLTSESYRKLPDGELIGDRKHYSCLPPTIHPDTGKPYTWRIPLLALPPVIDPIEAGLIPPVELERKYLSIPYPKLRLWTQQLGSVLAEGGVGGGQGGTTAEIEGVIQETLPAGYGQRNHSLFRLARGLKALPEYASAKTEKLMPLVEYWHRLALPRIRTKDFFESWKDFAVAWERVRSGGDGAILAGVREWACARTDDPLLRLELSCEVIQGRTGCRPFFLGCRTAAALIGIGKSEAAKLLKRLVATGVLHIEQISDNANRKATVYRYRGPSIFDTNSTEVDPT